MTVRSANLEILAYLPPPLLSHLRVVLAGSPGYRLNATDRWETLVDALDHATADVAVVDPCADGVCRSAPLAALLEARLTLPVVVYTPVSPVSFQAIAELARHSAHHAVHQVVLHRYDDEPHRFLELLERQPGTSLTTALLEDLVSVVAALPPTLSRAVERLIRHPTEFRDVADLARAGRVTVRTAYRHLSTAGVRSPRALVVAARLLQAYGYARDPRHSLTAIATKVGYSAPRMLTKHMREVVGTTPRAVRRQMRPPEFVRAVSHWLAPPSVPTSLLASSQVMRNGVGYETTGALTRAAHAHPSDRAQPGEQSIEQETVVALTAQLGSREADVVRAPTAQPAPADGRGESAESSGRTDRRSPRLWALAPPPI
jgi:AraC-like DNA-binding protein